MASAVTNGASTATNQASSDQYVKLNVGGRRFVTSKATLFKYAPNFFTGMLANAMPPSKLDEKGYIILDRPIRSFEVILDYLRTGVLVERDALIEADAEFYGYKLPNAKDVKEIRQEEVLSPEPAMEVLLDLYQSQLLKAKEIIDIQVKAIAEGERSKDCVGYGYRRLTSECETTVCADQGGIYVPLTQLQTLNNQKSHDALRDYTQQLLCMFTNDVWETVTTENTFMMTINPKVRSTAWFQERMEDKSYDLHDISGKYLKE